MRFASALHSCAHFSTDAVLYDSYHGAYIDVGYTIKVSPSKQRSLTLVSQCDVLRPFLRSDLSKVAKFVVEVLLPKGQQQGGTGAYFHLDMFVSLPFMPDSDPEPSAIRHQR